MQVGCGCRGTSEAKCPESSGCRSHACVQGDCSSHAKQSWVESFPYRVLVYIRARLLSVTFCQMKSPPPVIVTYRLLPKGTTPSSTLSVPLQSCPCSHVWGSGWVASRPPTTDVFVVTAGDPTAEWGAIPGDESDQGLTAPYKARRREGKRWLLLDFIGFFLCVVWDASFVGWCWAGAHQPEWRTDLLQCRCFVVRLLVW